MSFESFSTSSRELLNFVAETLFHELHQDETLLVSFRGEETDYLRWNKSKVRQNTSVLQRHITFELHKNQRRLAKGFAASGNLEWDLIEARQLLTQARLEITAFPIDPFLVRFANHGSSESIFPGKLLPAEDMVAGIAGPAAEVDLAGLYAGGTVAVGNRNSLGQNHWFANETFFIDYSLYNGERAVKSVYAGFEWQQTQFQNSLRQTSEQLAVMNRPRKKLTPGDYRVYLAPGALSELVPMLSWGALSYQAYKNGSSALKKLADHERRFSKQFAVSENFGLGLTPRFNSLGELADETLPLIADGELKQFLTSSRSAAEYQVPGNKASVSEAPRALEIHSGDLHKDQILKKLGTGLYVSNLHYANWSDRQNARVTGMTRYACLWVENGEVVAPIEDMRFDVSFFDIFGDHLLAITDFQEMDPVVDTYGERSLGGRKLPGILIEKFTLTL